MTDEPVIELRDVSFAYSGPPVLEDVNLIDPPASRCASSAPTAAARRRFCG